MNEKELLNFFVNKYNMPLEDALNELEKMKNKDIIQKHQYKIFQGSNGRWYTYLPDSSKPNGRKQIAKATEDALHKAIIKDYKDRAEKEDIRNLHLENLFEIWMLWRKDTGTDPKTLRENLSDWRCIISPNKMSKKKVKDINSFDIETFFLEITKNHAITYKRMVNVKSVLNGVFKHALRLKIIPHNPMTDIDYKEYRQRCKPVNSKKDNYTDEERHLILDYLKDQEDIYSLSIQLAFYLCLRIGELISLKKDDYKGTTLRINRSCRRHQVMNDDFTFGQIEYCVEERIKGNLDNGFRTVPLTPQAQEIIEKAIKLYPEGEYLFMRNGNIILADVFNRHLKSVCTKLSIPYRSSHQIRFTTATKLYEGGIKINQLSTFLGHSDIKTTMHYIRQNKKIDDDTNKIVTNILDF